MLWIIKHFSCRLEELMLIYWFASWQMRLLMLYNYFLNELITKTRAEYRMYSNESSYPYRCLNLRCFNLFVIKKVTSVLKNKSPNMLQNWHCFWSLIYASALAVCGACSIKLPMSPTPLRVLIPVRQHFRSKVRCHYVDFPDVFFVTTNNG